MYKYLIGFDIALNNTGVALGAVDGEVLDITKVFMISSNVDKPHLDRLQDFNQQAYNFLKDFKKKNKGTILVVIEDQFFNNYQKSAMICGGFTRYVLQDICKQLNIQTKIVSNTTVKKVVAGSGRATKEQVAKALFELYPTLNKICKTNDETDAVGLIHTTHINSITQGDKKPCKKTQKKKIL